MGIAGIHSVSAVNRLEMQESLEWRTEYNAAPPSRKRKSSYSPEGRQSRVFQGGFTPHQTLNDPPLFDNDFISSAKDEMDHEPLTTPASIVPTQALRRHHIAEEHEVSDTATNTSGRSTPECPSSISTYSSTDTFRTNSCSSKQPLSRNLALGSEECVDFVVHCDLLGFMKRHYGENMNLHTLGSVISLSGTTHQAQATTAEEYINQQWPRTGPILLETLQSAINSKDHKCQVSSSGVYLNVDLDIPKEARVQVRGSRPSVHEISFQLEWIGCAFQFSGSGEIEYSTAIKDQYHPSVMKFQLQPIPKESASCWFPLFANSVIARDFPAAHRTNDEQGIEVPFGVMAALAGVRYLVEYEDATILKGSSCMLVPIQNYHASIQWHLVPAFEYDQIQQRPRSSDIHCKRRVSVQTTDLYRKRAFLGWCKKAEIRLGTRNIDYRKIDYTKTLENGPEIRFSEFPLSLQIPAGPIGVSIGANVQYGARDQNVYNTGQPTLEDVIRQAENTPVVLYDEPEKRGWLVPASGVILHMLCTRYHWPPVQGEEQLTGLVYANPGHNGFKAAGIALRESATASNQREVSFLEKAVFNLWNKLQTDNENTGSLIAFRGLRGPNEVRGLEYMDLVEQNPILRQKIARVQNPNGGWVKLVRDIKCPVVIAKGLGDIIKPASTKPGSGSQCCRSWMRLPVGKDYLGASTDVLQGLFNRAGSRSDYQYLTTRSSGRIQWHSPRGSNLFGVCETPCRCRPLQRLVQRGILTGPLSHPTQLRMDGAVIFGYGQKTLQMAHGNPSREIDVSPHVDVTVKSPKEVVSPPTSAPIEIFDCNSHAPESESPTTPISVGYFPSSVGIRGTLQQPERSLTGDTLNNNFEMPDSEERRRMGEIFIDTTSVQDSVVIDRPMSPVRRRMVDTFIDTASVQDSMVIDRPVSPERRLKGGIFNDTLLLQDSMVIDRPMSPERRVMSDISNITSSVQDSKVTVWPRSPEQHPMGDNLDVTPPEPSTVIGPPSSPASKYKGGKTFPSNEKL